MNAGEPLPWQIEKRPWTIDYRQWKKTAIEKPVPCSEMQRLALIAYTELLRLKNYSPNTISVYRNWFTPLD